MLTHLQQTTLENIVAKGEIVQNKQFLLLPQCFQLYSVIIPSILETFHILYFRICCMLGRVKSTSL